MPGKGKVGAWAETAFKKVEQRGGEVYGTPAVIECDPNKTQAVASALERAGYQVTGIVGNFVFSDLPQPADFEIVARLPNVRLVQIQKQIYPMALGLDELTKQIGINQDPLLSQMEPSDLEALGVKTKPTAELPTPFQAATNMVTEAFKFGMNPVGQLTEYMRGFPPVLARADWRLVTDTRALMGAPEEYDISEETLVAVIDTGVSPHPAIGLPFTDYECISLTTEPPLDTMGHGTWVSSCAFGRPAPTRYGQYIPVASPASFIHMKVFSAFGPCTSFQIMQAMEQSAKQGCKVVNMSLGGPLQGSVDEDPECRMAEQLYKQYGTIFVVAAGNDGEAWSINSPAASPFVLTVGALDWKDPIQVASYSSRGPQGKWYHDNPDIYARDLKKYKENLLKPDVVGIGGDQESQIVAAVTPWYDGVYDFMPDQYDLMIGTSMATPHVAGLVALALDRGHIRGLEEIKTRMKARSPKKTRGVGYGLLTWQILGG